MSETFRQAVSKKLPHLPPTRAPWAEGGEEEAMGQDGEEEEEDDGSTLGELGHALPPTQPRLRRLSSTSSLPDQDLSPLPASSFFAQALEVTPPGNDTTFRVYLTPPTVPSGGGKGQGTYLVCHHGGGASGLSFATLAREVREQGKGELGVVSFDARGHGKTRTAGPKERDSDLSLPTLVDDFLGIITHLFPDPKEAPSLLLCGHSVGAAPILSAAPDLQERGYKVVGVVVLDVVEGTALESLPNMKGILMQRPHQFRSVVEAIHWHLTSNSIRNATSARVSVPSYLMPCPESSEPGATSTAQTWRTHLLATEPYWKEWYHGLSQKFLSAKCARLLVLAGQERLDKDLMVGQMQGKFQLEVMSDVGHYLHEDDPAKLAQTLITFWRRNTRVLVLPPKIGSPAFGASGGGGGGNTVKRVGED